MPVLSDLDKFMGRTIEIIYMDRSGRLTQRTVELRAVRASHIYTFCLRRGEPRVFATDRILAVMPGRRAVV
jgi:predicted DNA-binding transcriptional regulator YafY